MSKAPFSSLVARTSYLGAILENVCMKEETRASSFIKSKRLSELSSFWMQVPLLVYKSPRTPLDEMRAAATCVNNLLEVLSLSKLKPTTESGI